MVRLVVARAPHSMTAQGRGSMSAPEPEVVLSPEACRTTSSGVHDKQRWLAVSREEPEFVHTVRIGPPARGLVHDGSARPGFSVDSCQRVVSQWRHGSPSSLLLKEMDQARDPH